MGTTGLWPLGAVQASIWKVRADAVGLLAKVAVGAPDRSARPTAFVEDCAVPVAEMPDFIAAFRSLLDDAGVVYVKMSLTAPGCPVAGEMPGWVEDAVSAVPGVQSVSAELAWEPQWGMDMMTDEARLELGFM